MQSPPKDRPYSGSGGQGDGSAFRVRHLYKGIILGVIIGVVYCLITQDIVAQAGAPVNCPGYGGPELTAGNSTTNSDFWLSIDGPPLASELERIHWILALWEASPLLNNSRDDSDPLVQQARLKLGHLRLPPPHLEDCAARAEEYSRLDSRNLNGDRPVWSFWQGEAGTFDEQEQNAQVEDSEEIVGDAELKSGPFPPWVEGSDEDNLPMTRRVQRDIWLLQHPRNCSHESVRFLIADWPVSARFGLGAQLVYVGGLLAISMREKRVLVLRKLDRADHEGCQGPSRARWSCYFLPETTHECRMRAQELAQKKLRRKKIADEGILFGGSIRQAWFPDLPTFWGVPWEHMQPTTEIEGHLLVKYNNKHVRFWRAQAVRYFMRFPSKYTCTLMNKARHDAWGVKAATMVLRASQVQELGLQQEADMEKWIWRSQKAWVPRPLLSVHVRIGDKGKEMKLMDFDAYMSLANRLRVRFPQVQNIWLSSEMQSVIDSSKRYAAWNFYYTDVPRQVGNTSMHDYEAAMGAEKSLQNSIVNFLMAADADYFVGALGSTWCFLIDGMRSTGGKQTAGYLSVNRDRYWR